MMKSEFVAFRATREQREKLLCLARQAGKPDNMSAGIRWWLDQTQVIEKNAEKKNSDVSAYQGQHVATA